MTEIWRRLSIWLWRLKHGRHWHCDDSWDCGWIGKGGNFD